MVKPKAYPTGTINPGTFMHRFLLTCVLLLAALQAQEFTRGVGAYPGDPKQNWSPTLQPASEEYRNLALHRPAYHSSSYDFNLTAQLITDGVKETAMPRRIAVTTSQQGLLKKNERERVFEWFHRLDDELTRQSQGTGVGLPVVWASDWSEIPTLFA